MRHGLRQNIFKWAFGLKGTAYSNCSLHTSHHFHSSLSTLLHGGRLFSIFDSYSSRNSANMQFYLFFTDLMNEPQIHRRTFSCDFLIAGASGPFPIFPTSVPVFISASSMSKIEAGHMWKDVWPNSSSYFRVATALLISSSFSFPPIMPSRGCPTDWLGQFVCACVHTCVCVLFVLAPAADHSASSFCLEWNVRFEHLSSSSDRWTKRHKQSMPESNTHTVDRIQTPIVDRLPPRRDIAW